MWVLDGKEAITLISFIIRKGLLTLLYDLITLWPCASDFPTVTMFLSVNKICLIAPFSWISIPAHAGVWEAFLKDSAPLGHPKSPALMGLRLKKLNIQLLLSYSFLFDAEEQLGRLWRSCKGEVDSDPAPWLPWDWQLAHLLGLQHVVIQVGSKWPCGLPPPLSLLSLFLLVPWHSQCCCWVLTGIGHLSGSCPCACLIGIR